MRSMNNHKLSIDLLSKASPYLFIVVAHVLHFLPLEHFNHDLTMEDV